MMTNKQICDYESVVVAGEEFETYYEELHGEPLDGDGVRLISLMCFRGNGIRYDAYEVEFRGVQFNMYYEPNSDRVLYSPSQYLLSDSRKMQRCRDKIMRFSKLLNRKPHKSTAWHVLSISSVPIMEVFSK